MISALQYGSEHEL